MDTKPTFTPVSETTEELYNQNEIVRRVIEQCNNAKYTVDACTDVNGPSVLFIQDHTVTKPYAEAKRGVRIKFISEITKGNLPYCKELMKIAEVRHLSIVLPHEVKGNLSIVDGYTYYASATSTEPEPPPQLIISTVKAIVQQYYDVMALSDTSQAEYDIIITTLEEEE